MLKKQNNSLIQELYAFYLRKIIYKIMQLDPVDACKISENDSRLLAFHNRLPPSTKVLKSPDAKTFFKFIAHDVLQLTNNVARDTIATPQVKTLNFYAAAIAPQEQSPELELASNQILDFEVFAKKFGNKSSDFITRLRCEHFSYKYDTLFPYMLDIKALYQKIILENHEFLAAETALSIIHSSTQKLYLVDVLRLMLELHGDGRGVAAVGYFVQKFFEAYCSEGDKIMQFIQLGVHENATYYYLAYFLVSNPPVLAGEAEKDAYREVLYAILEELQVSQLYSRKLVLSIISNYKPADFGELQRHPLLAYYGAFCESGTSLRGICTDIGSKFGLSNPHIWALWLGYYGRLLQNNAREAEKMLLRLLPLKEFVGVAASDDFGRLVLWPLVNKNERHIAKIARYYQENWAEAFERYSGAGYFLKAASE